MLLINPSVFASLAELPSSSPHVKKSKCHHSNKAPYLLPQAQGLADLSSKHRFSEGWTCCECERQNPPAILPHVNSTNSSRCEDASCSHRRCSVCKTWPRSSNSTSSKNPSTLRQIQSPTLSNSRNTTGEIEELDPFLNIDAATDDSDIYSDAGSIDEYPQSYATVLENHIFEEVRNLGLQHCEQMLAALIREFAIRLGSQSEHRDLRRMMYIAHKQSLYVSFSTKFIVPRLSALTSRTYMLYLLRRIAENVCRGSVSSVEGNWIEEGSNTSSDASHKASKLKGTGYSAEAVKEWVEKTPEPADILPESNHWFEFESHSRIVDEQWIRWDDALRRSEAYRWLVSIIHRELQSDQEMTRAMRSHRQKILRILKDETRKHEYGKISRNRPPAIYTVRIELPWDIIAFLENQEYNEDTLSATIGKVITISGGPQGAQALPCRKYLEQTWPTTGGAFTDMLENLVAKPDNIRHCKCC